MPTRLVTMAAFDLPFDYCSKQLADQSHARKRRGRMQLYLPHLAIKSRVGFRILSPGPLYGMQSGADNNTDEWSACGRTERIHIKRQPVQRIEFVISYVCWAWQH